MKTLEIILRLIDKLLTAISLKKAQDEREKLSQDPANWFNTHFGYGVSDTKDKANKAIPPSDTSN